MATRPPFEHGLGPEPGPWACRVSHATEVVFGWMVRVLGKGNAANGRSLAYVWGFGATCLTATILVTHPRSTNVGGLVLVAVPGYAFAGVMFLRAEELTPLILEVITYFGQFL